jgi:DNA-binding CsgD family transcriptional regulator
MKNPEIIAIVKSGFYRPAIKQLLTEIGINNNIEFKDSLQDCLRGVEKPRFLILDALAIPEPHNFSLEKVKTKNPECNILTFNSNLINREAQPYIDRLVYPEASESELQSHFEMFFKIKEKEETSSGDNTLSEREKQVVQLVALGKTNKEISDTLHISPHTVITHRKNITSKLGIKTIAGLAVYAVLNGLIDPEDVNN